MNVTMIGLGKLGMPVAEVMAQQHDVRGYDIDPTITSDTVKVCASHELACQDADIVFIAVPTPHQPQYGGQAPTSDLPPQDFDYQPLWSALEGVRASAPATALIVCISTVLPGTLRPMIGQLHIGDRFCYNPYLIAMGTVQHDFEHPDILIMGFDRWPSATHQAQADQLCEFYNSIQHTDTHITCGTWEEAECIKIFHNTYISAKITIANMIQDVTSAIGHANPTRIADALSRCDRIVSDRYMQPGMGDGGPCHPRDNIALSWLAQHLDLGYDIFHDIMRAREQQARRVADLIESYQLPIHIMGRAFKPGVDLCDGSSAELVAHYCDHAVTYDSVSDQPAVYLLAHDRAYNDEWAPGSVIVDMHRSYTTQRDDIRVVWYGMRDGEPPPQ